MHTECCTLPRKTLPLTTPLPVSQLSLSTAVRKDIFITKVFLLALLQLALRHVCLCDLIHCLGFWDFPTSPTANTAKLFGNLEHFKLLLNLLQTTLHVSSFSQLVLFAVPSNTDTRSQPALIVNILCQKKVQIHSKKICRAVFGPQIFLSHTQSLACSYFRVRRSPSWSELWGESVCFQHISSPRKVFQYESRVAQQSLCLNQLLPELWSSWLILQHRSLSKASSCPKSPPLKENGTHPPNKVQAHENKTNAIHHTVPAGSKSQRLQKLVCTCSCQRRPQLGVQSAETSGQVIGLKGRNPWWPEKQKYNTMCFSSSQKLCLDQ